MNRLRSKDVPATTPLQTPTPHLQPLVRDGQIDLADATTKLASLDFYIKMAFVFAGMFVLIRMRRQIFEDPQLDRAPLSGKAKMLAWASLACWFGAITTGRLLAYVK